MNDKREIFGWTMYDWANSAFSTTVITALLGPYILDLAQNSEIPLNILGTDVEAAAIYPLAVALSVILQVIFLPVLGTIADYTNLKKQLLMYFAYAGSITTILMFFIRADMPVIGTNGAVLLASLLLIIANLCFGGAVVFYNAFLPEIASPDQRDAVSSRGFAYGYLGGGLLLAINFGMLYAMEDKVLALRLSLASAGVWWLVFTYLFPQQRLKKRDAPRSLPEGTNVIKFSFREIWSTLKEMYEKYPITLQYLIAYLIFNDGIQTVIAVSTSYAADELAVESTTLLLLVLMIQFTAFFGAFIFGYLAQQIGAKKSVMLSLVIWSGLVIYAYLWLQTVTQLFIMGAVLAIVLGGSQALSRSLFAQMIPKDSEAQYFGFYEISERGTSWLGPIAFAAAAQITGTQRLALLSLIVFFVVGLALLSRVNVKAAMIAAGNDPEGVVL